MASAVTAAHAVKIDEVRGPERNAVTVKVAVVVVVEEVAVMAVVEAIRAVPIGNNNPERLAEAAQSRLEKSNMKRSESHHDESQNAKRERDRVSLRMKVSATSLLTE